MFPVVLQTVHTDARYERERRDQGWVPKTGANMASLDNNNNNNNVSVYSGHFVLMVNIHTGETLQEA